MPILGFSLFDGFGSRSSDLPSLSDVENPLPPCPGTPNCIRITKQIESPVDSVFTASSETLSQMNPSEMTVYSEELKIESVFQVFFFQDDLMLQLTKRDTKSTYLHIRSASRVGYSDLGVNRRRVKTFLRNLNERL